MNDKQEKFIRTGKVAMELKQCLNMKQFKMRYKDTIFKRYRDEADVG